MPTCRRKRVILTEPSDDLLRGAQHDANKEVFYLAQTGEIFENYEAYAARMSFYKMKHFQCEVTGKSGLDYFQARESELEEARTLHSRFPEPLKAAVLRSVQWQVMGRLDHLVEAVYDRYKARYFEGEKVFIDVQGDKFSARIAEVFPPKPVSLSIMNPLKRKRASSFANGAPSPIHTIGGDMSITLAESIDRDDPTKYIYRVQLLEEDKHPTDDMGAESQDEESDELDGLGLHREGERVKVERASVNGSSETKTTWGGSLMEVRCGVISRDRLAFSKSLLRRFLRECLDRDSSLASPWTVKNAIAERYHVPTEMPDDIKEGMQKARQGEIDKRKRMWEEKELLAEKEGRPTKKMKKAKEREQKAAEKAAKQEEKKRDAEAKAAAAALAKAEATAAAELASKEEAERLAAEKAKQKKKPMRYPTEDLDIRITERDKRAGMIPTRPVPSRSLDKLPFNEMKGAFEGFLATWNFFMCFGQPLHLSSFTLDEYEHALRHSVPDAPCLLIAEIHSVLIYNLRIVPFNRHAAVLSLLDYKNSLPVDLETENGDAIGIDELVAAMADVGNNWERVPLKHADGRIGWEEALIGCLKDHATLETFPRLRPIFSHLLLLPPLGQAPRPDPTDPSSLFSEEAGNSDTRTVSPSAQYYSLPPSDRIAILKFMCDLAASSKSVHAHMESCEERLTALRKEKIEMNRIKKQYVEEMGTLSDEKGEASAPMEAPTVMSSDLSDVDSEEPEPEAPPSEDVSEAGSSATPSASRRVSSTPTSSAPTHTRSVKLRIKVAPHIPPPALAKQRELDRAKSASVKQAQAEYRRLDEEVGRVERRLEAIEREFRQLLGTVRVKTLGRDRFYNRLWWFDGCGTTASLVGSGGVVQYGTGRVFVQGASEFDAEILERKEESDGIEARRMEEEGEEGMLGTGEWAVYTELEEIQEFVTWLNPKGIRELALKNSITKWWEHLAPGIRKRQADLNASARNAEARRSTRKAAASDVSREPYMLWTNRKAIN